MDASVFDAVRVSAASVEGCFGRRVVPAANSLA